MKKSRMILLVAVAAFVLLSGTTAFAASYTGEFNFGYTTSQKVQIKKNGYIHMQNTLAQYKSGDDWNDGAEFTAIALRNGDSYATKLTNGDTDHVFRWSGNSGKGKLRFVNDQDPWHNNNKLRNSGFFY